MKKVLGAFAIMILAGHTTLASDIYVRSTTGATRARAEKSDVTDMVKRSVSRMPNETLVEDERSADYILQPSIIERNHEAYLRIEKRKDGQLIGTSEQALRTVNAAPDRAMSVTESALRNNASATIGAQQSQIDNDGTAMTGAGSTGMVSGGESSSRMPYYRDPNSPHSIELAVGPSFPIGLGTDQPMVDVMVDYGYKATSMVKAKVFGDFNFASAADTAHFINLGIAGEVAASQFATHRGTPYGVADLGFAFVRDNQSRSENAGALGVGTGFRFMAASLDLDASVHYTYLTASIQDTHPSVFAVRVAAGF
jgi:hypothetical protein